MEPTQYRVKVNSWHPRIPIGYLLVLFARIVVYDREAPRMFRVSCHRPTGTCISVVVEYAMIDVLVTQGPLGHRRPVKSEMSFVVARLYDNPVFWV